MPKTSTSVVFIFEAQEMARICQGKGKVVITSYLEEVKTQGGEKVRAIRVKAIGKGKPKPATKLPASAVIYGCPKPPCSDE